MQFCGAASSFKQVKFETPAIYCGDKIELKSQVVYRSDIQVATQSATKIVLSYATKIACLNGP